MKKFNTTYDAADWIDEEHLLNKLQLIFSPSCHSLDNSRGWLFQNTHVQSHSESKHKPKPMQDPISICIYDSITPSIQVPAWLKVQTSIHSAQCWLTTPRLRVCLHTKLGFLPSRVLSFQKGITGEVWLESREGRIITKTIGLETKNNGQFSYVYSLCPSCLYYQGYLQICNTSPCRDHQKYYKLFIKSNLDVEE